MAKRMFLGFALAFILMLSSCGTQTVLDANWLVPQTATRSFNTLAVIAMLKDSAQSKEFEIAAADKIRRESGVQTVPGFSILGEDANLSEAEMERRIVESGVDGILMFKMIAVDTTRSYVPPTAYVVPDLSYNTWWDDPYWGYYNPFPYHYWGYWYPAMQVISSPGYWTTESTHRVETTLYRADTGKLVWTGLSTTYNPAVHADLAKSLVDAILPTLKRDGLLASVE